MNITPILTLLLLLPAMGVRAEETIDDSTPARAIASLTDPKKLATLKGERASNPRFQKCLYWLATARKRGEMPEHVIASANLKNGEQTTPYGTILSSSLTASLAGADKLGLLSPEGMEELRRGNSATITKGDYAGQEATADHYIPRSVCPELDNQIFNLRLLPSKLNSSKGDKVGKEQVEFAERALAACDEMPAYGRVDLVRLDDGSLAVMELELVEPELWLRLYPPAADAMAAAIAAVISADT